MYIENLEMLFLLDLQNYFFRISKIISSIFSKIISSGSPKKKTLILYAFSIFWLSLERNYYKYRAIFMKKRLKTKFLIPRAIIFIYCTTDSLSEEDKA